MRTFIDIEQIGGNHYRTKGAGAPCRYVVIRPDGYVTASDAAGSTGGPVVGHCPSIRPTWFEATV